MKPSFAIFEEEFDVKKLEYIGEDSWSRPVYRDETGKLWKDVNLGEGVPALHSSVGNDFDGEPDMPIRDEFEIVNKSDVPDERLKFRYMLLGRLRSDCNYYLGYGNRKPSRLWGGSEAEHIEQMKQMWNSFSELEKPEWLTWDQILDYEKEMMKSQEDGK